MKEDTHKSAFDREQSLERDLKKKVEELKNVLEDCERIRKYEKLSVNETLTMGLNKDLAEVK